MSDDMQRELAELRAQVAELRKTRQPKRRTAAGEPPAEGAEAPEAESAAPAGEAGEATAPHESELGRHVDELIELFQREARDMPVITTLAVFVAGIIVGRLTR